MEIEEKQHNSAGISRFDKVIDIVWKAMLCVLVVGALHFGRRIFIAERFNVQTIVIGTAWVAVSVLLTHHCCPLG